MRNSVVRGAYSVHRTSPRKYLVLSASAASEQNKYICGLQALAFHLSGFAAARSRGRKQNKYGRESADDVGNINRFSPPKSYLMFDGVRWGKTWENNTRCAAEPREAQKEISRTQKPASRFFLALRCCCRRRRRSRSCWLSI